MSKIMLESSDGQTFQADKQAMLISEHLKNSLEFSDGSAPIKLDNVGGAALKKIIEYCEHHHSAAGDGGGGGGGGGDALAAWDAEFCKLEQERLFDLITAANYLDIKPLLDLTCKTVAAMLKGKTPEEIRKMFNIKNDFTPEEEAQVMKENEVRT